jgi:hypothetical protein
VLSSLTRKIATALGPASVTARFPTESTVAANRTAPGSEVTTGCSDAPPRALTSKSLMAPVLPFVVTSSLPPSGVNATWPGEELRRRVGVETQRAVPRWDRRQQRANAAVALDRAAVAGVEHVDDVAVHRHGDRKLPSVGRTWRRNIRSPLTASTVIVLLPALTAMSWPFSRS